MAPAHFIMVSALAISDMDRNLMVEWCERKRDEAKDGETAYHYHQLAEMWRNRFEPVSM